MMTTQTKTIGYRVTALRVNLESYARAVGVEIPPVGRAFRDRAEAEDAVRRLDEAKTAIDRELRVQFAVERCRI